MNLSPEHAIYASLESARAWLRDNQLPGGGWQGNAQVGPALTAISYAVLRHLKLIDDHHALGIRNYLLARQAADGSFSDNADVPTGSAAATAGCWAGLLATGLSEQDEPVAKAKAWLDANGGMEAVAAGWTSDVCMTGAYLSLLGHMDPSLMPKIPLAWVEIPHINDLISKVISGGFLLGSQQMAMVLAHARGEHISSRIVRTIEQHSATYQNPNGGVGGILPQTLIFTAAFAVGGGDTSALAHAVAWLQDQVVIDGDEAYYLAFGSDVWDTAFALRGLLVSETPADDPMIQDAVRHLLEVQSETNMSDFTPTDGPRTGGWPFQKGNVTAPDTDDTGAALGALGLFTMGAGAKGLVPDLVADTQDGIDAALAFLSGMQDENGGWGAYAHGLPQKGPGSMYLAHKIDFAHPFGALKDLHDKILSMGDPPTAGLVGRVLEGYGRNDADVASPRVANAVRFLKAQQLPDGSWWGRWMANYLAGTSWVLLGLTSVGCRDTAMLDRAVAFLTSHQNPDGGFGETIDSYADASLAGQGPSMPGLTGLVLSALVRAGGPDDAIQRAVSYLLATQRDDGTWPNNGWQHVFIGPRFFYVLPLSNISMPMEGLGHALHRARGLKVHSAGQVEHTRKTAARRGDAPRPTTPVRDGDTWFPDALREWRAIGDPSADAVVAKVFAAGEQRQVSAAFRSLVTNADPIPEDLPSELKTWLADAVVLPDWLDPGQVQRAQGLYQRVGWCFALALFSSSLPQAYAGAHGARVLMETQGLTEHTRRRILETAQFIFDVMDHNAFAPGGRGLAAARKVRLLHASVREYTLMRAGWTAERWGIPINQEDLAGTIMTFSVCVLDAMDVMGLSFSEDEADAWMHTWAVVAHLMGVDDALLAKTRASGSALMEAIRDDQWAPSLHGQTLAKQLCEAMADYVPAPKSIALQLPYALVRELAGDRCADILGIPQSPKATELLDDGFHVLDEVAKFFHRDGHRPSATARLATDVMQRLIGVQREGKNTSFVMPSGLMHRWTLKD